MKPTVYGLIFFRPEFIINNVLYPASFMQSESTTVNEAVVDWAEVMVEDATRADGAPLYEYIAQVNGITAMTSMPMTTIGQDQGELDPWRHKDEISHILLLAGCEMDHLLAKKKNEDWFTAQGEAVALGILQPTNGPGRRN